MEFFKKEELKLYWPLYLADFIGMAVPDIDMLIIIFFFTKGFTATQVGIGFALYSLFIIISEIPTGAVADLYGKRVSTQIFELMSAFIFIGFFFLSSVWMMWILFSMRGIAKTFKSGAFDALPYQIAKDNNRPDLVNEFYGKHGFITQSGTALSNINVIIFIFFVGATTEYLFLGQVHQGLDFLWLTGALGYLIPFFILFKIKEKVKPRKINFKQDVKDTIRTSISALKYSKNHPIVKNLFFMGVFLTIGSLFFANIVYQPFLIDLGIKVEHIAIAVAFAYLLGALLNLLPRKLEKKFSTEKKYLETVIMIKISLPILLFFFAGPIFSLIFFFVYFASDNLINPIMKPFKQFFYKKEIRASIGSVESLINSTTSIIFFPIVGFLVDNFSASNTVMFAPIPLLIALVIFKKINYSKRLAQDCYKKKLIN
jgi:MFS family permease